MPPDLETVEGVSALAYGVMSEVNPVLPNPPHNLNDAPQALKELLSSAVMFAVEHPALTSEALYDALAPQRAALGEPDEPYFLLSHDLRERYDLLAALLRTALYGWQNSPSYLHEGRLNEHL